MPERSSECSGDAQRGEDSGQGFVRCDRQQPFPLPPNLADPIPEGDPVWFVVETVKQMDLSPFRLRYRSDGRGRAAFDPEMMVALVVYSCMMGERSTRRMERLRVRDVAFRFLCGGRAPDHTTIARFRKDNAAHLERLFKEDPRLRAPAGMVGKSFASVDGTRIGASASMDKNRPLEHFKRWLRECDEAEAAEDAQREKKEARKRKEKESGEKMGGRKPGSPERVRAEMEKEIHCIRPESFPSLQQGQSIASIARGRVTLKVKSSGATSSARAFTVL